jgi:hypothetical protein
MAQRLEAALRRGPGGAARLSIPMTDMPHPDEPAVEPPAAAAERYEAQPGRREPPPGQSKKFYETLEQEMASLLGRSTGKT